MYMHINRGKDAVKIDFGMIYSDKIGDVKPVINRILLLWDLEHGRNRMRLV